MFATTFIMRYDTVKSSIARSYYDHPDIIDYDGDVYHIMCYYQKMNYG